MNFASIATELIRQSAESIILNSGKKGLLQLPTGSRFTREPISHEQLTELLLEAAPKQFRPAIREGRAPAPFRLKHNNESLVVRVDALRDSWSITIARENAEGKKQSARGQMSSRIVATPVQPGTRSEAPEPPWASPSSTETARDSGNDPDTGPSTRPQTGAKSFSKSGASTFSGGASIQVSWGDSASRAQPATSSAPGLSTQSVPPSAHATTVSPQTTVRQSSKADVNKGKGGRTPLKKGSPKDASDTASYPPTLAPGETPLIDTILRKLVREKGSDLHLTAGQVPRFRVSGNIVRVQDEAEISEEALRHMINQIIPDRIRNEFENTKDGDFAYSIEGVARFRVNVGMDRHGAFLVTRVIPNEILRPEQIGLPKKVLDLCYLSKGLVLVTGPTGSGKSTTLATLIDVINSNREDHIITIEDPIEFVHPDTKKCLIRQREIGEHTGSFKRALRAALREDPDIVLVGEMRDLETIAIALETAATGHLVFGTLHTSTAPATVDRIIDQFPANQQEQIRVTLSEALKGIIAQTLCKKIGGGRIAAFEILIGSRAVSNLIREGKTFQLYSTMQTSKQSGSVTQNESLLSLVKQRIISPEEAFIQAINKEELKEAMSKVGIRLNLQDLDEEF